MASQHYLMIPYLQALKILMRAQGLHAPPVLLQHLAMPHPQSPDDTYAGAGSARPSGQLRTSNTPSRERPPKRRFEPQEGDAAGGESIRARPSRCPTP